MTQVSYNNNMSNKISKIENFKHQNIVTLNQRVVDKRYLLLDLWENIEINDVTSPITTEVNNTKSTNDKYKQIFLQLNNLKANNQRTISSNNSNDSKIYFDVTNQYDIVACMTNIEDKTISILKEYLEKIHKRGKFNFCSIIKNYKDKNNNESLDLVVSVNNPDYNASFYDNNKMRVDYHNTLSAPSSASVSTPRKYDIIKKSQSTFNIILELMHINFDMKEGTIVIDTRLRLVMENKNRKNNFNSRRTFYY
jgi:hypothetical protein